jgi:O-antigen/teichoic acid export membrane protein
VKDTVTSAISDNAEAIVRDPLTLILTGLGISFAPHEYLGGLFLALAGASIASAMNRDQDRRRFWLVMLTAVFISHLAAMGAESIWPELPFQLVMALAGFGSRYLVKMMLRVFGILEERADKVADKIVARVLPDDRKDK